MTDMSPPTMEDIHTAAKNIAPFINQTPVHTWRGPELEAALGTETQVIAKLELFQRSGSFKARGALVNMLALSEAQKARGVTAVSAGNHAIAVAYAAKALGIDAKVVMQNSANPARIAAAEGFGAQVIIGGDGPSSFAKAEAIERDEGRSFIHPFEGRNTAIGTGTLGAEFIAQAETLDAVIIAIGGGGLAGGLSNAIKLVSPKCQIFGVEPKGADGMSRSFESGSTVQLEKVDTIADSLGPPMTLPYSYGLCRANVDTIARVSDDAIAKAAVVLFREMKLAVEPACAATFAGLSGPFAKALRGKRVGLVLCGSNIDVATHAALMQRAVE